MRQKVEPIIRRAGRVLLSHYGKVQSVRQKTFRGDVESKADLASERTIVSGLRKAFPEDAILTEEHPNAKPGKNSRLWIVDSLDGSRNFVLGVPLFGISIALVLGERAKFGMIYLPIFNELYWAEHGKGAFGNGKRLGVNKQQSLDQAMIAVAVVYHAGINGKLVARIDAKLRQHDAWNINLGNMVIPLCLVASGKYDGVLYLGASVWDVAAGVLIVHEAGGVVTDLRGNPWSWRSSPQHIVASNPALHRKLLREVVGA